jgi:hypothetical protein
VRADGQAGSEELPGFSGDSAENPWRITATHTIDLKRQIARGLIRFETLHGFGQAA